MPRLSDKLTDLDFAILENLPLEGSTFGNHTYAKQVASLVEDLEDAKSSQIQGRLRSMKHFELVQDVTVQPVALGRGWQRTHAGDQILTERRGNKSGADVIRIHHRAG